MSNIDEQLDEILAQYENNLWNRDVRDGMFSKALTNEQAKQAIKQLINQAKIEEVEKMIQDFEWGSGTDKMTDRLKKLKSE